MAPRKWRLLGAVAAVALLTYGCADRDKQQAREETELTRSLIDAASSAEKQGDPATAVNYYRSALARDPYSAPAAIGLMDTLRVTGGLDEARAVAEKALVTHPDDHGVVAEAGKVKLATGQLDDAIKLLKKAVAGDDQDWKSRSALGLAYDRVGEYAKAEESYRAALAIAPDSAAILNNYALSRAMANDLAGARELLQRAAASPSADVRVRQNLALVYALGGDMAKAEDLTRHDLPPALVGQELDYYRGLAATAKLPPSSRSAPRPALSPDRSEAEPAPQKAARVTVTPSELAALVSALPEPAAPPAKVAAAPMPAPAPAALAAAVPPPELHAPPAPEAVAPMAVASSPPPDLRRHASAGHFTVQLATYATVASARRAVGQFAAKGLGASVSRLAGHHGRGWFVVRAGAFDSGAEAHDLLERVQAMGCADAMVVRHEGAVERKA